jgi:ABC-type lipoprotein export system ATPase subunit
MPETYTRAKFWKCALQVNPFNYKGDYRGEDHGMSEDQYNQKLVTVALENDVKVIGIANHGNVDGVDTIQKIMKEQGIIVFPGFEITSTEKVHFVCLFSEETTKSQLHMYLGNLGLTKPENGVWPSDLGGNEILKKVDDLGGFVYAAHCTDESGILNRKLTHVWQSTLLKAAQISGTIDDLKNDEGVMYRKILRNVDPAYARELPIGILNAKDVAIPDDLSNPKSSCLIKMTRPCFGSFKLAFQDPESRVHLNSDVPQKYFSCIDHVKITGGYLDNTDIDFSDHLNSVIGGRGTGKSTLLECIRYAFSLRPMSKNAQKQHDEIIKENLGKEKGRVEIKIRSSKMNGKKFIIARRYGENIVVTDDTGNPSSFSTYDLLPGIEIYGQNEIFEIAQDKSSQYKLLSRFLETSNPDNGGQIQQALKKLTENRQKLIDTQNKIETIEDEVARLPKLEERAGVFKSLGIEDKLKIVPLLEIEKQLLGRSLEEETVNLDRTFMMVFDNLPDTTFLNSASLENLPHADILKKVKIALDDLRKYAEFLLGQWREKYETTKKELDSFANELNVKINEEETKLEKIFKDIPSSEGKTGKQIGSEYQDLLKEIERIKPKKSMIDAHKKLQTELLKQRQSILNELSLLRTERSAQFTRALKKLNKRLEGKLEMEIKPEAVRRPVIDFLLNCKLEGIGEGRLAWVNEVDDFSPWKLSKMIQDGFNAIKESGWDITDTVANALIRIPNDKVLQMEELELSDHVEIRLNTAHDGGKNFKPLEKLSTGQQCTAILHLLLLQNVDPLIMDQPEDNLDNAFIAERIVTELRAAKIERQFIFATHNANIPVFGDAEWIGILETDEKQGKLSQEMQGAIDVPVIRDNAAIILEGGKAAFNQRKDKYGF